MIAVDGQATAETGVHPLVQGHVLPVFAPDAIPTRVGRVDFRKLAPSFCRFGSKFAEKSRPRGVLNTLCQTMIIGHAVDM